MTTSSDESKEPSADTSSDQPGESEPGAITDDQLPEDLRPTDDNPLAKSADEDDESSGGPSLPGPGTDDVPGVEPGA